MAKYITSSLVILAIVENIQYVTKTHTKQKKKNIDIHSWLCMKINSYNKH